MLALSRYRAAISNVFLSCLFGIFRYIKEGGREQRENSSLRFVFQMYNVSVFHGSILWVFKNKYFLNLIIICSDSFILLVFVCSGFCNKNNHKLVILLA